MKYFFPLSLLATCLLLNACNKDVSGSGGVCYLATAPYVYSSGGAQFLLPNAFTPNGDGRNDVFRPIGVTGLTNMSMTIFDKNNNVMYRSNDLYPSGWDGNTNSGIPLADDKYTVSFQFTTVNGDHVTQSTCVALVTYGTKGCLTRSLDANYYFEDQFDPTTPGHYYATTEVVCP